MLSLFIGTPELIFIVFVVVLIFGTNKVPDIVRQLGGIMRNIRGAANEIQYEITKDFDSDLRPKEPNDSVKKEYSRNGGKILK